MQNAYREIHNLKTQVRGTLRLGLSHYIGLLKIPPVLNQFAVLYPDVELEIQFCDSESAQQTLLEGAIDLAVVTLPKSLNREAHSELQAQLVWHDRLSFVAHKSHPLCSKSRLELAQIAQYPAILPGMDTVTGQLIAQAFAHAGIQLNASHPTNNLDNIKVMIATGFMPNCWSVLPSLMIEQQTLHALALSGSELTRLLGVMRHRKRTMSNAARAFLTLLISDQHSDVEFAPLDI